MNDKALVTLVVGDACRSSWERTFLPTWNTYAARHGYDIVAIDAPIDPTSRAGERPIHWQKCLILEDERVRRYRRVAWVDADVMINPGAPDVVAATPEGKVGAVSHNARYRRSASVIAATETRFYEFAAPFGIPTPAHGGEPAAMYRLCGLPDGIDDMVNTGVLVFAPERHAPLLRRVYDTGIQGPHSLYEMVPLSHALLGSGEVAFIDEGFNVIYSYEAVAHHPHALMKKATLRDKMLAVNAVWGASYFLHFTSGGTREHAELVMKDCGDVRATLLAMEFAERLQG